MLVANYHAPEESSIESSVAILRKYGVQNIRLQKDVFNPELYFRLLNIASMGDLGRMTQYKSASEDKRTAHLLTYPVLMAHDIAGYHEVMVGEDQTQHLQYSRKLIRKHNQKFGTDFPVPTPVVVVGRIKDLIDPSKKMSKSSPKGCLFLDDKPDEISSKLRKATADELGLENLRFLYREFVGGVVPESNQKLKEELAEKIVEVFK